MSGNQVEISMPQGDPDVDEAVEQGTGSLYFIPRRLGATAPHDCSIWSVDYRDGDEVPPDGAPPDPDTRRLGDTSLTAQLKTLMVAGLRVEL